MEALARAFLDAHPGLRLVALGAAANEAPLDLRPFGVEATFLAAEAHAPLVDRYRAANAYAFPGALALPGWVLSDLYLLPGIVGLLLGPAALLDDAARERLAIAPADEAIVAAYVGAPSIHAATFIGVSLLSLAPGIGAGAWIKALTLRMLRAARVRGVAQWDSPSMPTHARMGPLRVVSRVPGAHELGARSFVYETDLGDERAWADAMSRRVTYDGSERVSTKDLPALETLLARAEAGDRIWVVGTSGGREDTSLLVAHGALAR